MKIEEDIWYAIMIIYLIICVCVCVWERVGVEGEIRINFIFTKYAPHRRGDQYYDLSSSVNDRASVTIVHLRELFFSIADLPTDTRRL